MSDLDWPARFERTPANDRERCHKFEATLAATTGDIETEMGRMNVDQWRASISNQHTKAGGNGLPLGDANPDDPGFVLRWSDEGEQFAVACDAYTDLRDNCREVFLWIHETRLRAQRAVTTGCSEFAAAALPSGDDVAVAGTSAAHEVLGVAPEADETEVRDAARELKIETHPDHGGSSAELQRVIEAEEVLLE